MVEKERRKRARKKERLAGVLEERAGRREGMFSGVGWVYFDFDVEAGRRWLTIETSWLPGCDPKLKKRLEALGFKRRRDGAYRVVLSEEEIRDHVGVMRRTTQAMLAIFEEQVFVVPNKNQDEEKE